MEIIFTEYDPSNWTEGDEASLTHCAWHGRRQGSTPKTAQSK